MSRTFSPTQRTTDPHLSTLGEEKWKRDGAGKSGPGVVYGLLAALLAVGALARFWNLAWDGGAYSLHPDEWALNEVVRRIVPDLNPHFFFYGGFPIYLYRFSAEVLSWVTGLDWLDRQRLALVGRFWSAVASVGLLPVLFVVGRLVWSAWAGLVAAACGAGAALSIQAAHFGTVDSLLTLAGALVLWLSLRLATQPGIRSYALVGVVLGLAVATKLTAITFVVMPLLAHIWHYRRGGVEGKRPGIWLLITTGCAVMACLVASPYYFLDWRGLLESVRVQSDELGGSSLVYTWQFIGSTPYLFELRNLAVWGLGLPLGVAALGGWVWALVETVRWRKAQMAVLVVWPTFYLLLIGTWQARFVRHTLPLVPLCCLFAAGGIASLYMRLRGSEHARRVRGALGMSVAGLVTAGALLWGGAFSSIYLAKDTRLAATEWIYANVKKGSIVILEDKNQPLPVPGIGGGNPGQYGYKVLPVTEPESQAKMDDFAAKLATGDLLIVPNRRWSGVLPRLADFPLTGRYYRTLKSGELGYTPLATFASPPRLGPFEWPDDSAEETFQVFDHPTAQLYRNTGRLSAAQLGAILRTTAENRQ